MSWLMTFAAIVTTFNLVPQFGKGATTGQMAIGLSIWALVITSFIAGAVALQVMR